jgi:hypothetical protein
MGYMLKCIIMDPTGSPLGPLFANLFMSHFEGKHMKRMKELGLKTWMRFVNDIHATVGDRTELTMDTRTRSTGKRLSRVCI